MAKRTMVLSSQFRFSHQRSGNTELLLKKQYDLKEIRSKRTLLGDSMTSIADYIIEIRISG
eukprot:CAMPEP_0171746794 /NCGR_PEP_ID=MMETSP0991-20121206/39032_1 /TAXON_ID=483369 /ORGANISM="non described non described, Strain CCMP2098" /LENGTH=60 /DNA_ID=CAMNT_0012346653 /DNA_START=17 /DNA_END=199 /DNA_ORIENTATION=+